MIRRLAASLVCLVLFGTGWATAFGTGTAVAEKHACCPPDACACPQCDCKMDAKAIQDEVQVFACVLPAATLPELPGPITIGNECADSQIITRGESVLRLVFGRGPPGRAPPLFS